EALATENDVVTFGKVAFRVKQVSPPLRRQVVPQVSSEFTGAKPASGAIVRQLPVNVSGGVPAIVTATPSGASHTKVTAKSLEELREKKVELLLEISKELSKQQELDRLLDKVVEFTFQVMNVDRVSILLLEAATGELVPRISRGRTAQSSASKHVPQSIARKVVEDRVAILSDNTAADERFKGKSILIQSVRSAMCTPLMGTDQKVLGILFSDIRGFTPMSETMSPDAIATLLTAYFTEMVEVVFEHGGTLDKFMGDAIMALWGAPMAHEDDADRAMRCALDQLAALEKLNAKWEDEGRPALAIGIGINFGEVFAGNVGSDRRLEYTVIGDAVNTAKRLCDTAGANEILISEPFYQQLKQPPKV